MAGPQRPHKARATPAASSHKPPCAASGVGAISQHTHSHPGSFHTFPQRVRAVAPSADRAMPRPWRPLLLDKVGPGRGLRWSPGDAWTHLDQACGRVPPLLKVLLPVLLLNLQGKARPQDALQFVRVRPHPRDPHTPIHQGQTTPWEPMSPTFTRVRPVSTDPYLPHLHQGQTASRDPSPHNPSAPRGKNPLACRRPGGAHAELRVASLPLHPEESAHPS